MAPFDVFRNPRGGAYPLLLDMQSEVLSRLATRVVVPLISMKQYGARPITRLNPTATVRGTTYVLLFQELAAVPTSALGRYVSSLHARRTELIAALDLLYTGF